MAISPFIFSSGNLPKLKAKQLVKTFSHLKLSTAQEATARALGYPSWFECTHRGAMGQPSLSDQDAGLSARVERYYHQANVLMGIGLTPSEADKWVRTWGLTGQPTLTPEYGRPLYYAWHEALVRFERGEIDEPLLLESYGARGGSNYPDIDRPQRICAGVMLGPMGKYPHYVLDPAIAGQIPIYLRGINCHYHYEDDGDVLAMCIPGFPASEVFEKLSPRLNLVQHEWHFGTKHPDARVECVPRLVAAAMERPDELIVLTQRWMPLPDGKYDHTRYALACLRGSDFATFLNRKGVIDPSSVMWFRDVELPNAFIDWGTWLDGYGWGPDLPALPVFEAGRKLKPSLPLYSYPFMSAPMSSHEYGGLAERLVLLPLDEDYDGE